MLCLQGGHATKRGGEELRAGALAGELEVARELDNGCVNKSPLTLLAVAQLPAVPLVTCVVAVILPWCTKL